jgi:hypothetical protein
MDCWWRIEEIDVELEQLVRLLEMDAMGDRYVFSLDIGLKNGHEIKGCGAAGGLVPI